MVIQSGMENSDFSDFHDPFSGVCNPLDLQTVPCKQHDYMDAHSLAHTIMQLTP